MEHVLVGLGIAILGLIIFVAVASVIIVTAGFRLLFGMWGDDV